MKGEGEFNKEVKNTQFKLKILFNFSQLECAICLEKLSTHDTLTKHFKAKHEK
jgi:hypothetical protein